MSAHNIAFISLLFSSNFIHGSAFATGLLLTKCSNEVACNPLFTQAEQHEANFLKAYEQCSQAHDCDTNEEYLQVKHLVVCSIIQLMEHRNNLGKDACYQNEKAESKNIQKRLIALLEKK